jgi:hypothetical protein
MKIVDRMLVFDVDGVITNPKKKRVTEPEILDEIIKQLERSDPIALVTGRAHEWIIDKVVGSIENRVKDKSFLDNLFISKEFGGACSIYEKGVRKDFLNEHSGVSKSLLNEVKKIVKNFSDSMFVDPDKKTMISIEMKDNFSIEKFRLFQAQFLKEIRKIIGKYDSAKQLDVHVDIIATNIRNKNANKRYATKQLLGWLSDKKISPKKYFVFGDTIGDRDIAQELYESKLPVKFVFVGEKMELGNKKSGFRTIFTQNKYDKGTLEFLNTL